MSQIRKRRSKKLRIKHKRETSYKIFEIMCFILCACLIGAVGYVIYYCVDHGRIIESLIAFCIFCSLLITTLIVFLITQLPERVTLLDVIDDEIDYVEAIFGCVVGEDKQVGRIYIGDASLVIDVPDYYLIKLEWFSISEVSVKDGNLLITTDSAEYCLTGEHPLKIAAASEMILQKIDESLVDDSDEDYYAYY